MGDLMDVRLEEPYYSAPEATLSALYAGRKADVWSCGILLVSARSI
jgi:serine/threonine protein kinase